MKAMVITRFGDPEVFAYREVNQPQLGKNELLVKVCATSVNPADKTLKTFKQNQIIHLLG